MTEFRLATRHATTRRAPVAAERHTLPTHDHPVMRISASVMRITAHPLQWGRVSSDGQERVHLVVLAVQDSQRFRPGPDH
ncbi:hypothetical protein [Salinifilum ghardaiensis]